MHRAASGVRNALKRSRRTNATPPLLEVLELLLEELLELRALMLPLLLVAASSRNSWGRVARLWARACAVTVFH
jgi:hypothetical protein